MLFVNVLLVSDSSKIKNMSQIVLQKEDALVGADLTPAYEALKQVNGS